MSFTFNWPRFSDQFHYNAIQMLNSALNKGNKPPVIADTIEVVELEMGTEPPELEIREIGELTMDQFRGIFRLSYAGDAHIVLKTKVQANPLNHKTQDIHLLAGGPSARGMLAARQPLVVPMHLRLSHFNLKSIVVLVVSKQKGITLVFKTDPLQSVDINSTFDSIVVLQNFIQREIESQLRQMFREDLPGIIHRLSQQWVKSKVEAPYLSAPVMPPPPPPSMHSSPDALPPRSLTHRSSRSSLRSRPPYHSTASLPPRPTPRPALSESEPQIPTSASDPDLGETFDPTYGLRPDGIPTKSLFKNFRQLFMPDKGLADLAEDDREDEEDALDEDAVESQADLQDLPSEYDDSPEYLYGSDYPDDVDNLSDPDAYDIVQWRNANYEEREPSPPQPEYETIPAVGGGTITRPRVYHSQSRILSSPASAPGVPAERPNPLSRGSFAESEPEFVRGSSRDLYRGNESSLDYRVEQSRLKQPLAPFRTNARPITPDSLETQPSRSSRSSWDDPHYDPRHLSDSWPTHAQPLRATPPYLSRSQTYDSSANWIPPPPPPLSHRSSSPMGSRNMPFRPPLNRSRRPSITSTTNTNVNADGVTLTLPPLDASSTSLHHLSTLSYSNHTLSPYTRAMEHFTVRSGPDPTSNQVRASARAGIVGIAAGVMNSKGKRPEVSRGEIKAKRKRTYKLGSAVAGNDAPPTQINLPSISEPVGEPLRNLYPDLRPPIQPLHPDDIDFDPIGDMDLYFRSNDASLDSQHLAVDQLTMRRASSERMTGQGFSSPMKTRTSGAASVASSSLSQQADGATSVTTVEGKPGPRIRRTYMHTN